MELSPRQTYYETPGQPGHDLTKLMLDKDEPDTHRLDGTGMYLQFIRFIYTRNHLVDTCITYMTVMYLMYCLIQSDFIRILHAYLLF